MTDARKLIADGRKHDEAMTDGPWEWDDDDGMLKQPDSRSWRGLRIDGDLVAFGAPTGEGDHRICMMDGDSSGIVWLRNNLRALLDGYEAALDQIKSDRALIDEQWRELAELRGVVKP